MSRSVSALALGFVLLSAMPALAAGPAFDSGPSGITERLLESAHRAAYHGRLTEAVGIVDHALAIAPNYGDAYEAKAAYEAEMGRYDAAERDLDRVIAMRPDSMALAMVKVRLALLQADGAGALTQLQLALHKPLFSAEREIREITAYSDGNAQQYQVNGHMESNADMYTSIAEQLQHHDDASIAAMQAMLKLEVVHPEYILSRYCYTAAVAGLLESAEMACQAAIDDNSHDIGQYDSLGFTHLRMKQWDKAIADYNKALDSRSDLTLSLYGRGIARRAKGDITGGNADIAAATKDEPDVANIMRRLGAPAA